METVVNYNLSSLVKSPDEFFYKVILNNECLNKYQRGSSQAEAYIADIINTSLGNVLITTAVESNDQDIAFVNILEEILNVKPNFNFFDPDLQKVFDNSITRWKKQFKNRNILQCLISEIIGHKYLPICLPNCKKDNIEDCYKTLCANGFLQKGKTSKSTFLKAFSSLNYYSFTLEDILKGYHIDSSYNIQIDFPSLEGVIWTDSLKGGLAYFANMLKDKIYPVQKQHYYKVFNDLIQFEADVNFKLKKNTSSTENASLTHLLDQALNELTK